jgi:hypothetical protein
MDHYDSIIPLIFRPIPWRGNVSAITFRQTTFYSCPKSIVDLLPKWREHEDTHKQQWKEDGWRFALWYLRDLVLKGYKDIPYEIEARKEAGE